VLDLFSDDMRRNPYPAYDHMRSRSPVFHVGPFDLWMIFDFDGVKRALVDHEAFSSDLSHAPGNGNPGVTSACSEHVAVGAAKNLLRSRRVARCRGYTMIPLIPAELDDIAFLSLAQRIMNGALAELKVHEVFLVHVDNWFDHKWLGWWSRKDEELRVPTFTPNRIRSEKHFVWNAARSAWESIALEKPLHVRQPGRRWLAQPLDRFSESAGFIWYSGNSVPNKIGSLMLYLSGADGYSWYASFRNGERWTVADECRITRRELLVFEERGRQLELANS
jgi:hypothetical protein